MEKEETRKARGSELVDKGLRGRPEKKERVVYAVKHGESWDRLFEGIRKFL